MKTLKLSFCLLLVMFSTLLQGQTAGSISGIARDPSDAVVQDAQVIVTNTATGATRSVTTNSSGYYTVPNLVPGTYTVEVEKAGFNAVKFENTPLTVAQALVLNAKFTVGSVQESVTVNGAPPWSDPASRSAEAPTGKSSAPAARSATIISFLIIPPLPLGSHKRPDKAS